jgi:hypothetical protein
MSYNVIAYLLYLAATLLLILWIGTTLYRNGKPFVIMCLGGNLQVAISVNKMLLTGYYLVNIGYAVYNLKIWEEVRGWLALLDAVGSKIGFILLLLGAMHIINVLALLLRKRAITQMHILMIKQNTNH